MNNISTNLQKLVDDRDDIRTALVAKGVTNASTHGFDDFATDIASIANIYTNADEGKVVNNGELISQTSVNVTSNGIVDTTTNNSVVVAVSNTYTVGDEGKVVQSGALVSQTAYPTTITENGTYNTTLNNSVTVESSSGFNNYDFLYDFAYLYNDTTRSVIPSGSIGTVKFYLYFNYYGTTKSNSVSQCLMHLSELKNKIATVTYTINNGDAGKYYICNYNAYLFIQNGIDDTSSLYSKQVDTYHYYYPAQSGYSYGFTRTYDLDFTDSEISTYINNYPDSIVGIRTDINVTSNGGILRYFRCNTSNAITITDA